MKPSDRAVAEGVLFTDEYQLTMAQLYYRAGLHDRHVQFDHFFRSCPDYGQHQAGYCVYAGLEWLLDWMAEVRVTDGDIAHLASQGNSRGEPVFGRDFLDWFREAGSFDGLTVRAVPEGRVVHPNVPLTVVQGPLVMAQILETALLNQLNYQTLIATKAARIRESCRGQAVLEFGLRRAQGRGGNAGARAALIGGADFSSNVGISHVLGYPPKGTHAHSMVQIFMTLGEGELGAFRAYADLYPEGCLLLVDTIDTLGSGLPNAIRVFEELRKKGHEPVGIRLDSGDLAYLAIQAARMLNAAGFKKAKIVLSNQLDELVIWQILTQIEAEASRYGVDPDHLIGRLTFGVGTRLITSKGASALDGVYKLAAVRDGDRWRPSTKISETPDKTINPVSRTSGGSTTGGAWPPRTCSLSETRTPGRQEASSSVTPPNHGRAAPSLTGRFPKWSPFSSTSSGTGTSSSSSRRLSRCASGGGGTSSVSTPESVVSSTPTATTSPSPGGCGT
jgi:nicotinate phosphoribosyltransferase